MPKHPHLISTREFVEKLDKIKKSSPSNEHAGYNAMWALCRLLDDHIYDDRDLPLCIKKDHLLVKEPNTGLFLAVKKETPHIRIDVRDIALSYDITRPKQAVVFGKYSYFPVIQESETSWKLNGNSWNTNIHIEPIFQNDIVGHRTGEIGEQLRNNVPIVGINLAHLNERIDLPFLKWVQQDCSKALNVLMNPQSSFFDLPNELKQRIFYFCIYDGSSTC